MSKIRVFYLEDETFLARIVKESLESRGFEVIMESDGEKALGAFRSSSANICVLDVMVPNRNGFAVAKEIRAYDKTIPILFLTAKTQTEDVVKGFSLGGNDYIRKPFSMEELIVRIHNLLQLNGKPNAIENGAVSIGKYTFHLSRQVLVGEQEERKLSYRETELLKMLYENRNSIIERKDILNLIWNNDSFFNSRTLDVYITRLRSYLKSDPSLEILTIKGVGYRFLIDLPT